jgi:hypothetical protein
VVARLKSIISSQAHLLEMKVENAGDEKILAKKIAGAKKIDINIDEIVNKIL